MILLGAYTRLTDAGLSCPDWPNCYGYVIAPHTDVQLKIAAEKYPLMPVNVKKAWTEMTHRYFAGMEGLLVLFLAFSILLARKAKDVKTTIIALSLIALLCVQVLLGMLTVTEKLKPLIVLAHLLTGVTLLSVLWWTYLDLHLHDDSFIKKSGATVAPWIWLAFFIVAIQITLGGYMSTHYAGLACIDFPYCNGQLLPKIQWNHLNTDLISIHMLHRIGALITAVYLTLFGLRLLNHASFRSIGTLVLALMILQITLGILNIIWLRPIWIALFHHAVGLILLMTLITALVKSSFIMDNRYDSWIA